MQNQDQQGSFGHTDFGHADKSSTTSRTSSLRGFNPRILAVCLLLMVAGLYFTGKLDRPLSEAGLNKNACVTNTFGAKFCGDDAKRVCKTFGGPACADVGYSTTGSVTDRSYR